MLYRDQCFQEPGVEHLSMPESDDHLLHERSLLDVLLCKDVLLKIILSYRRASQATNCSVA